MAHLRGASREVRGTGVSLRFAEATGKLSRETAKVHAASVDLPRRSVKALRNVRGVFARLALVARQAGPRLRLTAV
jgi:hypothetical protein